MSSHPSCRSLLRPLRHHRHAGAAGFQVARLRTSGRPRPSVPAASRINSGLKITGEVFGDSDLVIDGEVQGKVRLSSGRVTVGSSGRVTAEIEAREIVVEGTVQGNLKAADSVRLGPAGRVTGSVLTPRIAIDDGARLRGKVETTTPGTQSRGSSVATPVTRVAKELQSVAASADSE